MTKLERPERSAKTTVGAKGMERERVVLEGKILLQKQKAFARTSDIHDFRFIKKSRLLQKIVTERDHDRKGSRIGPGVALGVAQRPLAKRVFLLPPATRMLLATREIPKQVVRRPF
jgi:hypothetical protein